MKSLIQKWPRSIKETPECNHPPRIPDSSHSGKGIEAMSGYPNKENLDQFTLICPIQCKEHDSNMEKAHQDTQNNSLLQLGKRECKAINLEEDESTWKISTDSQDVCECGSIDSITFNILLGGFGPGYPKAG
jgi:hypothetical protein